MRWSWRLGKIAGIQINVHATFLLIVLWVGAAHWMQHQTIAAVVGGIVFLGALFSCVVLHELGHALTARRFGVATRDITLLPIGGVARLERMPDLPKQELLVALAGPAVNVVIAAALFLWLRLINPGIPLSEGMLVEQSFAGGLFLVNVLLVVFNMLPAFPMDGGRVVRSLLALKVSYRRATRVAARLGQVMAVIFGFLAFYFFNPFLFLIALFVWFGARQEAAYAEIRHALGGMAVEDAMMTHFVTFSPHDTLGAAVSRSLAGEQAEFPVVENSVMVGVITRDDLIEASHEHDAATPLMFLMRREFDVVEASDGLEAAFSRLNASQRTVAAVTRFGRLVGLLTLENIGDWIAIRGSLPHPRPA